MTNREAKRLAILKWEYIVECDGSDKLITSDLPELNKLEAQCSYCEMFNNIVYFNRSDKKRMYCKLCPIRRGYITCMNKESIHAKWYLNKTKENAQAVLDLIKTSKFKYK